MRNPIRVGLECFQVRSYPVVAEKKLASRVSGVNDYADHTEGRAMEPTRMAYSNKAAQGIIIHAA